RAVLQIATQVVEPRGEARPERLAEPPQAPMLFHRFAHLGAKLFVAQLRARHTHDREILREEASLEEGVARRHQLALAQISRRTEDHDGGMRHVLLHSAGGSRSGRIDRARRTRRGSVLERGFGRTRSLRVIHGSPSYASSFVAASTTRSAVT